jgi:formylglycine-generating enzyme required for sulfatase activity
MNQQKQQQNHLAQTVLCFIFKIYQCNLNFTFWRHKTKLCLLLIGYQTWCYGIDPVVSNVQAEQRAGTRLVDITYDVQDPDSPTLEVYLKVSPDGGQTWKGPVKMASGDVGRHILPGSKKRIVWNAGEENPNQFGKNYRYKIGVSDQPIAPSGMVLVPQGTFQMGENTHGFGDVFGPIHLVTVADFAIDEGEVSVKQWETVRNWGNLNGYNIISGGGIGVNNPVDNVSWYDILKWNNARSEMEKKEPSYYEDADGSIVYRRGERIPLGVKWKSGYRLPTEAEWEKAARGGMVLKFFPWGTDIITPMMANYIDANRGGTIPVKSYTKNGFGLYDVAGNVAEVCWDTYADYSFQSQLNPRGPLEGRSIVVRGGHCLNFGSQCRVSYRSTTVRDHRSMLIGFRSAINPENP